jgi:hypothetical protein
VQPDPTTDAAEAPASSPLPLLAEDELPASFSAGLGTTHAGVANGATRAGGALAKFLA